MCVDLEFDHAPGNLLSPRGFSVRGGAFDYGEANEIRIVATAWAPPDFLEWPTADRSKCRITVKSMCICGGSCRVVLITASGSAVDALFAAMDVAGHPELLIRGFVARLLREAKVR